MSDTRQIRSDSSAFQRFVSHVVKLIALFAFGTAGFMIIEHWRFLDALFMTVMTVTTVGYTEVHPLSDAGVVFDMVLIIVGVGLFLSIIGDLVSLSLEINIFKGHMRNKIVKLTDHQIICGFGRTGHEVAESFYLNHIPFVVIEQNPIAAQRVENNGFLVIEGDASSDEILNKAQVSKAKGIVCALPDDTQNTFIALSARGLNEKIDIVSRAANPGSEAKLKRVGARMVISPYVICGQRLAAAVTHPLVTQFLDVVMHTPEQDLRMEQVAIAERSILIGNSLKDANIKQTSGAMILAVNQSGKLITNPPPDLHFCVGDELIALGAQHELNKLAELAGNGELKKQ